MEQGTPTTLLLPIRGMTCIACVARIEEALRAVAGVTEAEVAVGRAVVHYDPGRVTPEALAQAVREAGYEIGPDTTNGIPRSLRLPALVGAAAALGLAVFYVVIISLLSADLEHGIGQVRDDAALVAPLVAGFGAQVGLFIHTRRILAARMGAKASAAMGASGAGVSTVTMVACCAHHASDVLPLLGIAGLAVFATEYKVPLMVVGIAANMAGIGLMAWRLRRATCHS
ncbi:MAG: heavy-metal-associated domain-containing protein [Chloroflexi bacterium]|nr:heavy-metal-associated domain-containing protein [Chloroflexota bacterium]